MTSLHVIASLHSAARVCPTKRLSFRKCLMTSSPIKNSGYAYGATQPSAYIYYSCKDYLKYKNASLLLQTNRTFEAAHLRTEPFLWLEFRIEELRNSKHRT